MNVKWVVWALLAFSVTCALPGASPAADGPYFSCGGFPPWPYLAPSIYVLERSPYFALHPPVYYSYPVRRTYGLFPYPYLPQAPALSVTLPHPSVVQNPYVAEKTAAARESGHEAEGPLVTLNPYVVRSGETGVAPEANLPGRVSVTFPTAMFSRAE
jgi:hypothetical protein